jgi:uncharacterized membrane protein YeaQ/YmgE (transglycosylase-associated protein family)
MVLLPPRVGQDRSHLSPEEHAVSLITFLVVGFLAGLIARALVSGPGPKGLVATTLLGMIGSLVGGFLGYLLFGHDVTKGAFQASGLLGSILGSIVVLLIYRSTGARRRVPRR